MFQQMGIGIVEVEVVVYVPAGKVYETIVTSRQEEDGVLRFHIFVGRFGKKRPQQFTVGCVIYFGTTSVLTAIQSLQVDVFFVGRPSDIC